MLTTEDAAEYDVQLLDGEITPPSATSPLEARMELQNRSTAHVHVRGLFAILDNSGRLVGRGRVEDKKYLPGQRNPMTASWIGELKPGHYTAVMTLSYDRAGLTPATLIKEFTFDVN